MYNAESALEPVGNNNSLYTPSAPPPCLSVSLCSNIQRICVLYSNLQMSHFSEAAAGGEKKKSKISMNTGGIWSETPGSIIAQRAPAERRRNAGEKEISRTRVPACHLNISFHACMPKAPHIHTEHTLSAPKTFRTKDTNTHTHTHVQGSMLEHTSTGVPGAGCFSEQSDIYRSERKGEEVLWGEVCYDSSGSN